MQQRRARFRAIFCRMNRHDRANLQQLEWLREALEQDTALPSKVLDVEVVAPVAPPQHQRQLEVIALDGLASPQEH